MALSLSETALLIASALRDRDVHAMRKINDRCIDETAVKFGQHTYLYALISYVLSKVISKPRYYTQKKAAESLAKVVQLLRSCESFSKQADYESLLASQNKILLAIEKMDDADRRFVKGIISKGKLKIASTLYAQGISLGSASEMSGTDKRELLLYAGQTMMFDRLKEKKSIHERMKDLREIFS
ncbi:TPA: hypothetical protein HA225_02970 [Candidatus Micrarchaeota archaeon]|nr:hypothetical protein [Candidatus Micrarchaeota archaeon]